MTIDLEKPACKHTHTAAGTAERISAFNTSGIVEIRIWSTAICYVGTSKSNAEDNIWAIPANEPTVIRLNDSQLWVDGGTGTDIYLNVQ